MDRARRLSLLVAAAPLVMGVSSFVACSGGEGGASLRREFPARAGEALTSARSFELGTDGVFAVQASARVRVALPAHGDDDIRFALEGGREIRVRERGASGRATREESAVRYRREGGAAFWTVNEQGVEEWLAVDHPVRGEPVASWTVEGATLRSVSGVVLAVDEEGKAMLRVAAPKAYGADGRAIGVHLAVAGDSLLLHVDADGERVLVDPSWTDAGTMGTARFAHTGSLLDDGRVLVTGGRGDFGATVSSAELWDPALEAWVPAANGGPGGPGQAAVTMSTGSVAVFGGLNGEPSSTVASYDPVGNSWSPLASMNTARDRHTATELLDGTIFIYGGAQFPAAGQRYSPPPADSYVATGGASNKSEHTATRLQDGRVLITGGTAGSEPTSAVEIYDPADDSVTGVQPMSSPRRAHAAVLLPDGRVLVAGGAGVVGTNASAEIFDPGSGWSGTDPMATPRQQFTLSVLPNGQVAAVGGDSDGSGSALASLELFDPAGNSGAGSWTGGLSMTDSRVAHTATILQDDTVLVAGGFVTFADALDTSEVYSSLGDLGDFCSLPTECGSGFCADNACCDSACTGECQTCDNEGSGICIDRPDDDLCAGGTCQGGTCVPDLLSNGESCDAGPECFSGFCVDDVCCGSICNGECQACSFDTGAPQDGTCGNAFDDTICSEGTCQEGICQEDLLPLGQPCDGGGECDSGICVDDVCCNSFCGGTCQACSEALGAVQDGTCGATEGRTCTNPFNCSDEDVCTNESICVAVDPPCPNTECIVDTFCNGKTNQCGGIPVSDDTPCGTGGSCQGGICIPPEPLDDGEPCTDGIQCDSGTCTDDVCCNDTCIGECVACSVDRGASADGVCSPVNEDAPCGKSTGTCVEGECTIALENGEQCAIADECESGNCVDDVCCNTACTNECTTCAGGANPGSCHPVDDDTACEGGSCQAGLCVLDNPKELGETCEDAGECASEFCVDGVCCDSVCDGECDACSTEEGADENGTCSNATSRECDDGNACTQTDLCESRACAGSDEVVCTPADCQVTASCASETGACVAVSKPDGAPCEGGVCIAGACQTDPDVGSLSGSGTGAGAGSPSGGTAGNASGPSGTASGPSGGTGAGNGNGNGNGEDGETDAESDGGCAIGERRGAGDLAWLVIAAALGARWRGGRRRDALRSGARPGDGRRAEP